MVLYVLAPLHERLDSSKSFRCWTFRFDNVIRTEVTTILMPSWATRVAIEKVWGRCFSSRSPNNLDGIEVNPFASSYLVGRLKWVDSLVGSNPSSSFMFVAPCCDLRIRFHGTIELDYTDWTLIWTIVELYEKGKHLTRNFWPARGICIEGSETVCVFSVNFHNSEFS